MPATGDLHVLRLCSSFEPPTPALAPRFAAFNVVGGMQNHVANLTRALDRQGVAQTVLTSRAPTAPLAQRIGERGLVLRPGLAVARARGVYALGAAVIAPVVARRADVVHAHVTIDLGLVPVAAAVARLHRLPLVVTVHTSLRHSLEVTDARTRRIQRWGGAVEHWVERRADAVIALAPRLRDRLTGDGIAPGKVHVIPSGVDPRRFAGRPADPFPDLRRPRLVFVGRLEPEKDVAVLLRAAARLARPVHIVVVGDGSERAPLLRLARELGIAGRVRLTGFLPHAELPAVLAHADVLVHPSRMEELGTAIVEAMYAGLPVVVSDCGGIPVAHGREGLRVTPGDVDGFAAAIERVLGEAELARRLGAAGRRRARREHDWDVLAARVLDVYRAVVAGGGAGAAEDSMSPGATPSEPSAAA